MGAQLLCGVVLLLGVAGPGVALVKHFSVLFLTHVATVPLPRAARTLEHLLVQALCVPTARAHPQHQQVTHPHHQQVTHSLGIHGHHVRQCPWCTWWGRICASRESTVSNTLQGRTPHLYVSQAQFCPHDQRSLYGLVHQASMAGSTLPLACSRYHLDVTEHNSTLSGVT
jgi:hypothetical protein